MLNVTYEQVKNVIKSKYGKWWTAPYDLNVFGIRNANNLANKFDDTLGIAYTDDKGVKRILLVPGTTDPGLYYLQNPLNAKGCAIVVEGYYPSLWKIGTHKGYKAWQQIGYVNIFRDNNKDNKIDVDMSKVEKVNNIGINFHRANPSGTTISVGKYSAGCQVVANAEDFSYCMKLGDLQKKYGHGDKFSYALLNEKDFQ